MEIQYMKTDKGQSNPNQSILFDRDCIVFISYGLNIVRIDIDHPKVTLDRDSWDYSRTTGKYRNLFLQETKKETQAKINSGEYSLGNLNPHETKYEDINRKGK